MLQKQQTFNTIENANIYSNIIDYAISTMWDDISDKPNGLTQENINEWNALKAKIDALMQMMPDGPWSLSPASKTVTGVVQIGNNINVNGAGLISVANASTGVAGVIKLGRGLSVDEHGYTNVDSSIIPTVNIATTSTPGIVMPGDDFDIDTTTGLLTLYKALTISGWSIDTSMAEVGASIASITGTFSLSKTPTVLKAGVSGSLADITPAQSGTTTITGPFTSNTTFVISAKDAKQTNPVTSNAYLTFGKYYYAHEESSDSVNPTGAYIQSWDKALTTTAARAIKMTSEKYLYYAVPANWALTKYNVGGFDYTWVIVNSSLSVTTSNNTTNYKVVRTASKINTGASVAIS